MSMLPSQLNLANNKPLSEGGKPFINRYRSDNSTYSAGDTIRIEIPCGRQQFLFPNDSFLEARLKVNCSNGATPGNCYIDATAFSIFNRMRIIHGSTVLEDTLYCNRLWNAVYDVQISESERRQDCITKLINDNTPTSSSHQYNPCLQGSIIQILSANVAAADSSLIDFSIVLPSALLGSLASKALPLGLLNSSSIYLELELAPMNVAFVTESSTIVFNSYTIQDIYYNAKITQLPEDINASLVASLRGDSIKLPAFAYKAELKSVASGSSAFNDKFAFNFSSVKSFYWWMTNQTTSIGSNTKRSVTRRTKAGATDFYLTINGEAFPSQTISNPSRMYMELVRSFDGLVDTSFGGVISYKNYIRDTHTTADDITASVANYQSLVPEKRFIAGIDLDRFNHSSDTLNSGTSTIGQTVNLVVNYAAGLNESCNLYAAVMYDVIFVAENGQLSPRF